MILSQNNPEQCKPQLDWKVHRKGGYSNKNTADISWHQSHPEHSLALIDSSDSKTSIA